jgi:hypothetical protein
LVGSFLPVEPSYVENESPFPYRRDEPEPDRVLLPSLLYWLVFLLLTGLLWLALAAQKMTTTNNILWAGILTLLFLPGVQLAASVLTVFVVAVCPEEFVPDKWAAIRRIGKITLWSVVGAIVGFVPMVLILLVLAVL